MTAPIIFRAIWPITDEAAGIGALIAEAEGDLPILLARAHAAIAKVSAGRWSVVASDAVPGSGRITKRVLMFEAPARPVPARAYRKGAA